MMTNQPASADIDEIPTGERDRGTILPLVLVFSVALAVVVGALATYATSTLKLGQTAERASDRLATANGAMDSALEDLERGVGPCLLFGKDYEMTDTVNDLTAQVECTWVGGRFNVGDLFAVVMTGAGAGRTGPLLTVTNGGNSANAEKIFEGPVYVADTPRSDGTDPTLQFSANLAVKNADLSYSTTDCGSATPSMPSLLSIIPVGYGTQCYEEPWSDPQMFGAFTPAEPGINSASFPSQSVATSVVDAFGCRIWSPGQYTAPPVLDNQSYNYFRSGDYYFNDMGNWVISSAFTLFGYPGATGPGIDGFMPSDTFANNPCNNAWTNDADVSGATIFLGGNSQITVDQNSTFEVSGRERSGQNIAVQALATSGSGRNPSTIVGDQRIITTGPGSNKQMSIEGLVWAPYAALEFDLISNDAVAALTGGAVVSELTAGASANANNFLIRVATKPADKILQLTTTATSPGGKGSTSVRSIVRVQRDGAATSYAVESRRIVGLTPEGSSTAPNPVPSTDSGPCNETRSSFTNDFGDGNWTAQYWNLPTFSTSTPPDPFSATPAFTEQLSRIDSYLGADSPLPGTVNADYYAARFTKTINVGSPCSFTLLAGADDGFRVFIDGAPVTGLSLWSDHAHTSLTAITPTLTAGVHTIVMEYYDRAGDSSFELEWSS
jgi:hypothetical protein